MEPESIFDRIAGFFARLIGPFVPASKPEPPKTLDEVPYSIRPTYQDVDQAVLHILNPKFRANRVGVEIGTIDEQTVLNEFSKISKYRNWLKTQIDPCLITAYNHWLDFFERQAQEANEAIRSNARAKWAAEWVTSRQKYDKIEDFARTLPRPEER